MSLGQLGPYLLCLTPIPLIHCDIFNIAIGLENMKKKMILLRQQFNGILHIQYFRIHNKENYYRDIRATYKEKKTPINKYC